MAWTRAYQLGYEMQSNDEHTLITSTTHPTNQSTTVYSGARAAQFTTSTYSTGRTFSGVTQARAGVFFRHVGVITTNAQATILVARNADGMLFRVSWYQSDNTLKLLVNSTIEDSIPASSTKIVNFNRWYCAGMIVKIDAPGGYVSFYLEHQKILSFAGDTTSQLGSGDNLTAFFCGGRHSNLVNGWTNGAIFDDFYIDTASGAETDETPPPRRFFYGSPNGNGAFSDWNGSDGDSTDNYLLVDDATPDDDTTYVAETADAMVDTYAHTDLTLPVGWDVTAAIPIARAKEQTAEANLKTITYDGSLFNTGGVQTLTASYAYYWERFATQPDASAWDEAAWEASEFGYESEI